MLSRGDAPISPPLGLLATQEPLPWEPGPQLSPRRPLAATCRGSVYLGTPVARGSPGMNTRDRVLGLCGLPIPLGCRKGSRGPRALPLSGSPAAGHSRHGGAAGDPFLTVTPTFAVILEKPIRIPRFLSVKASHVLKGFLNKVRLQPPACLQPPGQAESVAPWAPAPLGARAQPLRWVVSGGSGHLAAGGNLLPIPARPVGPRLLPTRQNRVTNYTQQTCGEEAGGAGGVLMEGGLGLCWSPAGGLPAGHGLQAWP